MRMAFSRSPGLYSETLIIAIKTTTIIKYMVNLGTVETH